jgi:hypothetical protein
VGLQLNGLAFSWRWDKKTSVFCTTFSVWNVIHERPEGVHFKLQMLVYTVPWFALNATYLFFDSHSTTQTFTTRTHTHPLWIHVRKPYSYEHRQITPMNTCTQDLEILEVTTTGSHHHWRLVVDGNVAYHLTHNILLWAPADHPYEYTYARSGDSRSHHHWRLVVDGNVAYHLTHNAEKSWNKTRKRS